MIVKVERPSPNAAAWLITNPSTMQYLPVRDFPDAVVNSMADTDEAFWHATRGEDGQLSFIRPAPAQHW